MLIRDIVNAYQTEYIKEIAEKGACVIVGRSADYILKEKKNCLNIFIHADPSDRVRRAIEEYNIAPSEAEKHVLERDKKRAKYYRHITDQIWGLAENYDLCLNSSKFSINKCADIIQDSCR